ncbi:TonB-dependent receptor [Pedobacter gandavensis]|uniref:SusC/RagA family TonB-linked outer membrane protein n=1 Tax=Pedobacter gandavensis TaxID=2679963 RepID=UPI0024797BA4|nr:TonB-dependent receptor [Pedobacter gandavensis]WGQ10637.1 TonB-dependent receptor [Pedobacter gandavensis]
MQGSFTTRSSRLFFIGAFFVSFFLHVAAFAQNRNITGNVTDVSKKGIAGATLQIEGTKRYTTTDAKGNFSIQSAATNEVLLISYTGFLTQKIIVGNRSVIHITLVEDTKLLNDVVVIGYGTVKRSDVTGAITSIQPDPNDASKSLSVENLLQGKVAGVSVSGSVAAPGAAMSVTIRGANSLRGDNQPLYIIDNIPQASTGAFPASALGGGDFQIPQNPLTNLNPSDIEDIQVLKDASATAIYGSRGANGVIIVTTKKGKQGKAKVNASANFTTVEATNLRNMLNLSEYANYRNERLGAAGAQFYPVGDEMRYVFSGQVYDANNPATYRLVTERNWQKEIYRKAFSQNYDLSVSGGENRIKYYLSADYKNINGLVKETDLQQGGLRLNLGGDISKSLTFNASMSGAIKKNNMMSGGNTKGGVTGSITRTAIDSAPFAIPSDDPMLISNDEAKTTTLSWLNDYDDIANEKSVRASADLTWKISKNFSYNVRTGGNVVVQDRSRWYGLQLFQGQNSNGLLALGDLNSNNYTFENLLNYNGHIGKIVNINATAGVTYDDYNWLSKSTTASNFQFKDLRTNGLHMASVINSLQPFQKDYQLLSYLSRLNLSFFNGKYLATATLRADGSSKFKVGNRWATFPSFALAWRADQEKWIKSLAWIDQLKLRAGYGKTGSQSISPYNSFYDYGQIVDYATAAGVKAIAIGVSNLQNSDLKWETTSAYNLGLDFNFWKGKLSGTIDAYYKETNDLLIEKNLPASTSFGSITMNQGSLSNKGIELSLSSELIKNESFSWSLSGNIGINRAKIIDLGLPETRFGNEMYKAYLGNSIGDHFGTANIFIVGKAPGLFWGYKTDGIIQTGEVSPTSVIFNQTPGNIKVVDVTGDGVIDVNDKTIIGNPNPDFSYGFQTAVSYKQFKFSAAFYGVQGGDVVNGNIRYEQMPSQQTSNMIGKAYAGAWRANAQSNLYPSVNSVLQNVVYDRYVEDASFLRCSDITLAYTVPKTWTNNQIGNINLFASVKNAFLITDYSGYDPEMRTFSFDGLRPGIDLNSFSNPRQFILGLNVTF